MKEPLIDVDPKFDNFLIRAIDAVTDCLKNQDLDIDIKWNYSSKCFSHIAAHGFGKLLNPSVYFRGIYKNTELEAELPIAVLNHKGMLRFLIPDNQGILQVINLNEKPKVYETVREANKKANERFRKKYRGGARGKGGVQISG